MAKFEMKLIPALSDNYIHLAHDPEANLTAVIDPAQSGPVFDALKDNSFWPRILILFSQMN